MWTGAGFARNGQRHTFLQQRGQCPLSQPCNRPRRTSCCCLNRLVFACPGIVGSSDLARLWQKRLTI